MSMTAPLLDPLRKQIRANYLPEEDEALARLVAAADLSEDAR
jgi:RHH-type proline utilization regulon transcriptional repressor/proline dehydrogenase/delta 1-pyrroline-5-carboxylate dehydrogenase